MRSVILFDNENKYKESTSIFLLKKERYDRKKVDSMIREVISL